MQFAPKTEDEVKRGNLLRPGECDFTVRDATDEVSDKGNEMIKLMLEVWDQDGEKAVVFDYLLEAMAHKLRHFCYAVGLGHIYEAGELTADHCIGKGGRLLIRNEQDKLKKYPPKNGVADYVLADRTKETPNYQTSKSNGMGGVALQQAKQAAWQEFGRQYKGDPAMKETEFRQAAARYFSNRALDSLGYLEWQKFTKDGFRPQDAPFSEQQEFKEDDIPF